MWSSLVAGFPYFYHVCSWPFFLCCSVTRESYGLIFHRTKYSPLRQLIRAHHPSISTFSTAFIVPFNNAQLPFRYLLRVRAALLSTSIIRMRVITVRPHMILLYLICAIKPTHNILLHFTLSLAMSTLLLYDICLLQLCWSVFLRSNEDPLHLWAEFSFISCLLLFHDACGVLSKGVYCGSFGVGLGWWSLRKMTLLFCVSC